MEQVQLVVGDCGMTAVLTLGVSFPRDTGQLVGAEPERMGRP